MDLAGRFLLFILVVLTLMCWTGCATSTHHVAYASTMPPASTPPSDQEPEGIRIRVARISYLEGPVTMQRTKDEDWIDAILNTPLMAGDKIYTGPGAKAEIQLEDEVTLRMAGDTYIQFKILDDGLGRIGILKGSLSVYAKEVNYARPPLEIISSNFATNILDNYALVRYDVQENGPAEIQVRRGHINVEKSPGNFLTLRRGERFIQEGPNPDSYRIASLRPEDDFDRWCDLQIAMDAASQSRNYISSRVAGYSDLDRYGDWVVVKEYGRVWRPRVISVEWSPYHDGRWMWRDPYGWTWVSYEPWGWVPYHYGRWVYVKSYDWCWVPHDVVHVVHHRPYRPVWHPALVSFTYASHGKYFHFSLGGSYYDGPCVGWFPLGPGDPYHPWYSRRACYVHPVHRGFLHRPSYFNNQIVINDIDIHYQNYDAPRAVTVMPRRDFNAPQKARRSYAKISYASSRHVEVGNTAIAKLPEREVTKSARVKESIASPQVEPRREVTTKTARTPAEAAAKSSASVQSRRSASTQDTRTSPKASLNTQTRKESVSPTTKQSRTANETPSVKSRRADSSPASNLSTNSRRSSPSSNTNSVKERRKSTTNSSSVSPQTKSTRSTKSQPSSRVSEPRSSSQSRSLQQQPESRIRSNSWDRSRSSISNPRTNNNRSISPRRSDNSYKSSTSNSRSSVESNNSWNRPRSSLNSRSTSELRSSPSNTRRTSPSTQRSNSYKSYTSRSTPRELELIQPRRSLPSINRESSSTNRSYRSNSSPSRSTEWNTYRSQPSRRVSPQRNSSQSSSSSSTYRFTQPRSAPRTYSYSPNRSYTQRNLNSQTYRRPSTSYNRSSSLSQPRSRSYQSLRSPGRSYSGRSTSPSLSSPRSAAPRSYSSASPSYRSPSSSRSSVRSTAPRSVQPKSSRSPSRSSSPRR